MHRSAFMQKCHKFAGLRSWKNATNSQVCGHGKMLKTRRSTLKEKCQKPAGPRSQKYANKLPVLPSERKGKMHRSEFLRKYQKLAGSWSWRILKNLQVRGHGNFQKLAGSQSQKYANKLLVLPSRRKGKNAYVSIFAKIPKNCRFSVTENAKITCS